MTARLMSKLLVQQCRNGSRLFSSATADGLIEKLDETQVKLLEETCILVDEKDKPIGKASKKTCHLLENINNGMLHRAFSIFLFNSKSELLIQQRSDHKITFPGHFTNTCCSHPLDFPLEKDETNAMGVKRAAQRKLYHELGITPDQVPLDNMHFLTRILYRADNVPADGIFGENELDYILFAQRDVTVQPNNNEVKTYRYVNKQQLRDLLVEADRGQVSITPWFHLITKQFLWAWWDNLHKLKTIADTKTIHKFI